MICEANFEREKVHKLKSPDMDTFLLTLNILDYIAHSIRQPLCTLYIHVYMT